MLPFNQQGRTPTYDLEEVQRLAGQGPISCRISSAARDGATDLDLEEEAITEAVLLLAPSDFYKTMESHETPGLWQDVYHLWFGGVDLYIKVQIDAAGRAVIISFKRR